MAPNRESRKLKSISGWLCDSSEYQTTGLLKLVCNQGVAEPGGEPGHGSRLLPIDEITIFG
jgi:hypothetical protein